MSAVIAVPELMAEAATDMATIGSNLSAAHMTAAAPTVVVLPAAADEVSAGIAHLFSQHAQGYQVLAEQAAAFHGEFVQRLTADAASFTSAEAANTALLQPLTASAASIGSTIADLAGQVSNAVQQGFQDFTRSLVLAIFAGLIVIWLIYGIALTYLGAFPDYAGLFGAPAI
jgi:hypothetical protein